MKSELKKVFKILSIIFGVILVTAIVFIVVGLRKAFWLDCDRTNYSMSVNEYKIEGQICSSGWGSYKTFHLKKNGKKISKSKHNWDACKLGFEIQNDLFIKFDTCNKIVEEVRPEKQAINLQSVDSILLFSASHAGQKKFTTNQVGKFIKDWNNCKTLEYRTYPSLRYNGIHSSSLSNRYYKIVVFEKNRKLSYTGFSSKVYDNSNWTYLISQVNNFDYFRAIWEDNESEQ